MNIVMPMAGRGARFVDRGYFTPKPLIHVEGRPMFSWALETIKDVDFDKLIIISLEEHRKYFDVDNLIRKYCPENTEIIFLSEVTEGQLCTVLAAKDFINTSEDLLIISADTIVASNLQKQIREDNFCQGIISVANLPGDRWSFASVDSEGNVIEVAEKIRISDYASTGLYYFRNGKDFVRIAEDIIFNQEKTRGEYYVIPVYQKYIKENKRVGIAQASEIWDLGTPDSLNDFMNFLKTDKLNQYYKDV